MVKLSSFHIAKIGTEVVSINASFIKITFCRADVELEPATFDGGPKGGNGLIDIEALVGLVIADDEELLPPWVELFPELTEELDRDPDPTEPSE